MQRYTSKAGESPLEGGCHWGNIMNCTNNKSARKKAISPIAIIPAFFLAATLGVAMISAKKAIMVMDEV